MTAPRDPVRDADSVAAQLTPPAIDPPPAIPAGPDPHDVAATQLIPPLAIDPPGPLADRAPHVMTRVHRAYVIAMCAIIGGAFAYAACDWGRWPHLTYVPLSGTFTLAPTTAIAIHYLGLVAWGAGGACSGALIGAIACSVVRRPWPRRAYQLLGAWAITAIVLAGGYFTWSLWPW